METNGMDTRILMRVLVRKWWLILLFGLICGCAAWYGLSKTSEPVYTATTQIYVRKTPKEGETITASDYQTGSYLSQDYTALIMSRAVQERVIENLHLDSEPEELGKMIRANIVNNTRFINISVTAKKPVLAKEIADETRETATQLIQEVLQVDYIAVVSEAQIPRNPDGDNHLFITLFTCTSSMILLVLILCIFAMKNRRIETERDVLEVLQQNVLAVIPHFHQNALEEKV